jgi:hypothetical protein
MLWVSMVKRFWAAVVAHSPHTWIAASPDGSVSHFDVHTSGSGHATISGARRIRAIRGQFLLTQIP